jgi:AraC-like DNA-binding protein
MHGYVVGLRVERASRRLLKTKSPIKRVAIDAGFRDAGQLVRAFRQHAGVTPGAYRNIFSGR